MALARRQQQHITFDLSTVQFIHLTPSPDEPVDCYKCSRPSTRVITRASNRNGNAGRPYDKCEPCGKFLRFADQRGNDPNNPHCDCGQSSKKYLTGVSNRKPRAVFYACRLGKCNFYGECNDARGEQVTVVEQLVPSLAALSII